MQIPDWIDRIEEISSSKSDTLAYLQEFRSLPQHKFALVYCPPREILEGFDSLIHATQVLHELSLYPVLVIDRSSLSYLRTFYKRGRFFPNKIHRVRDIRLDRVQKTIQDGKIPILVLPKNQQENEFSKSLHKLLHLLESRKLIYLLEDGGIYHRDFIISVINITKDYSEKFLSTISLEDSKRLLEFSKNCFQNYLAPRFTISFVSPHHVLKELFTIKGKGTLVKRGTEIVSFSTIPAESKEKIVHLIQDSFHKKLRPEFIDSPIERLYLESSARACSILKRTELGILLSKFAVGEIARGEGIGREIWDLILEDYPKFFWRAKGSNSINKWYAKEATGLHKSQDWIYYWIGHSPEEIPQIIQYLQSLPEDFLPPS